VSWESAVDAAQWFFLLYFVCLNLGYLALNACSMLELPRYLEARLLDQLPRAHSGYEPPVSVLVPAYNEEATIAASVRSMLQLDYPELEVIVVNDGSRDGTLEALRREFALLPYPEAYWRRLEVKPVRAIYRSTKFRNLRVIDKENGGKADALYAGINAARYPSSTRRRRLDPRPGAPHVVRLFLEDPRRSPRRFGTHHQWLHGSGRRTREGRPAAQSARAGAGCRIPARISRRAARLERRQRAADRLWRFWRVPS
jgi:hypothetical protein